MNTNKPVVAPLFSVNFRNVIEGIAVAVIASLLGVFQQMLTAHGFDFGAYDWSMILQVGAGAFMASLSKDFMTNEQGQILGASY